MSDRATKRKAERIVSYVLFFFVIVVVALVLVPALAKKYARSASHQTSAGIWVPCEVIEVVDGDTITVRVSCDVRVRLRDCWAPETRTSDANERLRGIDAREHLQRIALGKRGLLSVPLAGADRLDDVFSFGRILGRVSIKGGPTDVGAHQIQSGHAYRTKRELREAIHDND